MDRPRSLLDAGTGPGDIARGLAPDCDRVDAVDFSRGMIRAARALPGGNDPRIRWICAPALEQAGLFERLGQEVTGPVPWTPTVDEYVERRHSQNGFSRDRMPRDQAADFDGAVRERISEQVKEGSVRMEDGRLLGEVAGSVVWGKPMASAGLSWMD